VGSDPKSGKGGLQGGLHSSKTGGSFGLVASAGWAGRPDRTGLGPRLLRTQSNPLGGGSEVQASALMLTHCGEGWHRAGPGLRAGSGSARTDDNNGPGLRDRDGEPGPPRTC
jgi:hypothetical protein